MGVPDILRRAHHTWGSGAQIPPLHVLVSLNLFEKDCRSSCREKIDSVIERMEAQENEAKKAEQSSNPTIELEPQEKPEN